MPAGRGRPETCQVNKQLITSLFRSGYICHILANSSPSCWSTPYPADSSSLEFRRFHPLLSQLADVYAVDLAGWGFTDAGFGANPNLPLGPQQKRAHLRAFLKEVVRRPATLVGTSLGGEHLSRRHSPRICQAVSRAVVHRAAGAPAVPPPASLIPCQFSPAALPSEVLQPGAPADKSCAHGPRLAHSPPCLQARWPLTMLSTMGRTWSGWC